MFKFKEGMEIIVNRIQPTPVPSRDFREFTYTNEYPRVGWKGILVCHSDINEYEWEIDWTNTNGNSLVAATFHMFEEDDDGHTTFYIKEWMMAPYSMNKVFNIKDKVIYISGLHGISLSNPLWNSVFSNITGIVTHAGLSIKVSWSNNMRNSYFPEDLFLIDNLIKAQKRNIKKEIEDMCFHLYTY